MVNIIVLTHGEFGSRLIEAAESIAGRQDGGLACVSVSPRMPLDEVRRAVSGAVSTMASPDGLVVLVDMPGGTPMNVVLPIVKDVARCAIVCGVNINMLMSAFTYRRKLDFDSLTAKIIEDGRKAICEVGSLLAKKPRDAGLL